MPPMLRQSYKVKQIFSFTFMDVFRGVDKMLQGYPISLIIGPQSFLFAIVVICLLRLVSLCRLFFKNETCCHFELTMIQPRSKDNSELVLNRYHIIDDTSLMCKICVLVCLQHVPHLAQIYSTSGQLRPSNQTKRESPNN